MAEKKNRVLVLAGPTAVGKSDLGLALAARLGGEILAADSMQVYRRMDIGTAKPSPSERARVPHHLIDLVDPDEPFSAAAYTEAFRAAVDGVGRRGRLPIVVGGTGLYIRAAVKPFLFPDAGARPEIRARLALEAEESGPRHLHERLARLDPAAAAAIHPNDRRRLIRALEVIEATGRTISAWRNEHPPVEPYDLLYLVLNRDRAELYARIERRTDLMMEQGFLAEVSSLLAAGYRSDLPSMQGLGYRELCLHLAGRCSLEESVAAIKRRTRNYAKRQLTWFRAEPEASWLDLSGKTPEESTGEILRLLAGRWKEPSNN